MLRVISQLGSFTIATSEMKSWYSLILNKMKCLCLICKNYIFNRYITDLFDTCSNEHAQFLNQVICTKRQITFQILKNNNYKIGCNKAENKFYPLNGLIGLDTLNRSLVQFKKIMKVQFLKYGKTWKLKILILTAIWVACEYIV